MKLVYSSAGVIAAAAAALLSVSSGSLSAGMVDVPHKTKRSTPARTIHAAPDVTSTIAKPDATGTQLPPAEAAPPGEDVSIPPPFTLPPATRSRVRACGAQWRDMKMAGTTGDDDWRDFAMHCFVEDSAKPVAR